MDFKKITLTTIKYGAAFAIGSAATLLSYGVSKSLNKSIDDLDTKKEMEQKEPQQADTESVEDSED